MYQKIIEWDKIKTQVNQLKDKRIVFTNGCFDLIHRGHVEYLYKAKELGDILWVGLNSDSSVRKLKGSKRPIQTEEDRAIILAAFYFVDFVTIFSQDTPIELIQLIQPSIHVKGGDYTPSKLPESTVVESYGGKVVILPFVPGKSTTQIVKKLEKS